MLRGKADSERMFTDHLVERRVIFRPYSPLGQRANIYVCVGCGKHFVDRGDMGELATRFAEHLCDPIFPDSDERSPGLLKH